MLIDASIMKFSVETRLKLVSFSARNSFPLKIFAVNHFRFSSFHLKFNIVSISFFVSIRNLRRSE